MTKIQADQNPRFTIEVSEQEKEAAKALKKEFKDILKELGDAINVIYDLRDAIVQQRPTKEDLKNTYRGRLLRYRRKISTEFNKLFVRLMGAIKSLETVMDPETANLRKIIVAEFDELSDGVEGVLEILGDVDREGFTKNLERLCTQIQRRKTSIDEIIDNQLFSHLEHDILGKYKISCLKTRIYKRTRILRKTAAGSKKWDL